MQSAHNKAIPYLMLNLNTSPNHNFFSSSHKSKDLEKDNSVEKHFMQRKTKQANIDEVLTEILDYNIEQKLPIILPSPKPILKSPG